MTPPSTGLFGPHPLHPNLTTDPHLPSPGDQSSYNMNHDTHYLGSTRTSKLCKPLTAVLRDSGPQSMLDYFVQYMEGEGSLHLLQFWFAVETFKKASSTYPSPNHIKDHRPLFLQTPKMDSEQCINGVSMESSGIMCSHMTTTEGNKLTGNERPVGYVTENITVGNPTLMGPLGESNSEQYVFTRGREMMPSDSSASIKGQEGATADEEIPHRMQQQRLLKQLSLSKEVCFSSYCVEYPSIHDYACVYEEVSYLFILCYDSCML